MAIELFILVLCSVPQGLLLYVQPRSRFRSFAYEAFTVLTFFGGSIDFQTIYRLFSLSETNDNEQHKLYLAWIKCVRFTNKFVLLPTLTIMTMVYTGQELVSAHQNQLPSYDRGVIIFTVVCYSFVGIYLTLCWFKGCQVV